MCEYWSLSFLQIMLKPHMPMFLETGHTTWFCMLKNKDNQSVHVAWVTLSRQKLHIMWCKEKSNIIFHVWSMRVDTTWGQEAWYLTSTFLIRTVQLWTVLDWRQPGWVPANVVAEWPKPPQIVEIVGSYEDEGEERMLSRSHAIWLGWSKRAYFLYAQRSIFVRLESSLVHHEVTRLWVSSSNLRPHRCRLHVVLHFPIRQVSVSALVLFYNWLLESSNRNNHPLNQWRAQK